MSDETREVTPEQRTAIVDAMLEGARRVNAGDPPGDAIRDVMERLRAIAAGKTSVSPAGTQIALRTPAASAEPARREPSPAVRAQREAIVRIFDHWRRTLDHPQAKLTADRVSKVAARLREGYSEADLVAAIDGCANSPFHRGENESGTRYDDLIQICRSGSTVEKFREKAGFQGTDATVAPVQVDAAKVEEEREIRRLEFDARAMLKAGNVEGYNDAIRSIRERRAGLR